uniref:Uncharacterized protein n=1 Tax=Anguilla anguilla TaxID=7936 RepID=A0A0E9RI04_ANGAN
MQSNISFSQHGDRTQKYQSAFCGDCRSESRRCYPSCFSGSLRFFTNQARARPTRDARISDPGEICD